MITKYSSTLKLLLFIFGFIGISFFLYRPLYSQLITQSDPSKLILQGEYPVYEFIAETVRQNILTFSNPFAMTTQVLYPFGWRFALDDVAPINGFYFLILRNFLDIHQSFIIIVLLSIWLNGLCMYYLLRILQIPKLIAYIATIIFAYTPFVSLRLPAHPTYIALYLFPLTSICVIKLLHTPETALKEKIKWSIALGLSFVLFTLTNLYFTVMYGIMAALLLIFFYKSSMFILKKNWLYLLIGVCTAVLILLPWLTEVSSIISRRSIDKPKNIHDMVAFSADLITILIPSSLNPFYRYTVNLLGQRYTYIQNIFENFTYPGALILYGLVAYVIFRKRLPRELKALGLTIASFFILTLGPTLQIFGINTHVPLPYLAIAYTPLLQMVRSPGRFIVPFIFLSTIVLAYTLQYLLKNKTRKKQYVFLTFIFIICMIDQSIPMQRPPQVDLPIKIYEYLDQQEKTPLLEIPFSIRDSIKNYGHYHTHWSSYAQLFHHHPIFGIYAGRVPNTIYSYYTKNPLLNPIAQIVDINEKDTKTITEEIKKDQLIEVLNTYDVRYSVLKMNEPFSNDSSQLLKNTGFTKIKTDKKYTLWQRRPTHTEISFIKFDSTYPEILIGDGWSPAEPAEKARWMMGKTTRVFLSLNDINKKSFTISGQSIVGEQHLKIYINGAFAGDMKFTNEKHSTSRINLRNKLKKRLNIITLYATKTYKPSDYIPDSKDFRDLSLHVSHIGFQ